MSDMPYNPLPSTLVSKTADIDQPMNYNPLAPTLGMRTPAANLRDQVHQPGTYDARVENHLALGPEDLIMAPSWRPNTPGPGGNPPLGYHRLTNTTIKGHPEVRVPCWKYHKTKAPRLVASEKELDGLGSEWADTPFPPPPESLPRSVDERLQEHADILEALKEHAEEGEPPVATIHRMGHERDAYAKAVAETVVPTATQQARQVVRRPVEESAMADDPALSADTRKKG